MLESPVGRYFLPHGSDICTHCPLVLQLFQTKRKPDGSEEEEIHIRLKIFSPIVLDITFVDLPGITKVPVGDQPSDIEARIITMIMSYIKQPNCLILVVTSPNSDLTNSDALQIAGNADPYGYRTIGIITKVQILT
ncbi:Dynamin - like 2 [Theobroma cacao]|nr:Dynamin - like 2 [Theobroma cacao]